jgi:hypothetical protein
MGRRAMALALHEAAGYGLVHVLKEFGLSNSLELQHWMLSD